MVCHVKLAVNFVHFFEVLTLQNCGPKRTTKISQNHLMFSFTYFRQFLSTPIDLTSFFVVSNEIFDWSLHRDFHPFALLTALDCATKSDSEVPTAKSSLNFRRTLQLQNEFICFIRRPNSIDIEKYLLSKYFNLGSS